MDWTQQEYGWRLGIVPTLGGNGPFVVEKRRWVVDRAFAWLSPFRRLSTEYDELPESSEAWIYLATIQRLTRLLAAP